MVHFIIFDDILHPDPRDKYLYYGGLRKDQLEFIENDLKFVPKDHLVVLAMHIPLTEKFWGDTFRDEDRNKLFELLKPFPYTLSLSAHTHIQNQDFISSDDGWLQEKDHCQYNVGTTCGDWYSGQMDENKLPVSTMRDGTRKGYAFISFTKNQYVIDYKVAGKNSDYQFEIYAPKNIRQSKESSYEIAVNYFMGSELDSVYYKIDDGNWKLMKYKKSVDPSYYHSVQEWDYFDHLPDGTRPSNPIPCNHLWVSDLPSNLDLGNHIINIKTTDRYGRLLLQTKEFRVVE